MKAMEKFEATPLAMKIIAGLLVIMIGLSTAWAVDITKKLDAIIEVNAAQDKQIFINTGKLAEREVSFKALQDDVREIRADVKKLLER